MRNFWYQAKRLAILFALTIGAFTGAQAQTYSPELKIGQTADGSVVSWPLPNFYYILETTPNLTPPVSWTNTATASKLVASLAVRVPSLYGGIPQLTTNVSENEVLAVMPLTNVAQFYRLKSPTFIPIFCFAVFYDGPMEFTTCPPMTLNGPVHANGPIFTGSSSSNLVFNETVTTSSAISSPALNGASPPYAFVGDFLARPGCVTNAPRLVLGDLGTNSPHAIIEPPPAGENPDSEMGGLRFFNYAQVILAVSNASVTVRLQSGSYGRLPGADPSPVNLTFTNAASNITAALPFLTLTNVFYDQREYKTNLTTQIDVGRYSRWIQTNTAVLAKHPLGLVGTLYVADYRTTTASQQTVVRLTNGISPPANSGIGFTVATPNPLYVWGNYNQTNSANLASTNTSGTVPCALVSDALTILSANWRDANSTNRYTARVASTTTVNAAILTGNVPSTGTGSSQFSGGVQNLPRLLENWSSAALWLNTSLVCLFSSTRAVMPFRNPGDYYSVPQRYFNLDQNFSSCTWFPPTTFGVGIALPKTE